MILRLLITLQLISLVVSLALSTFVSAQYQAHQNLNHNAQPPSQQLSLAKRSEMDEYVSSNPYPAGTWFVIPAHFETIRKAHAALGASAVLLFLPLGAILIRVLNNRHMVWIHAGVQMFGYAVFITSSGMGIWMAKTTHGLHGYHPIMGMTILGLLIIQPITELINHYFYHRFPQTIYLAHVHLWLGRILITLGIVHGGLGFAYADSKPGPGWSKAPRTAYGVIATVVWIVYIVVATFWQDFKKRKSGVVNLAEEEEMEDLRRPNTQEQASEIEVNSGVREGHREFRSSAL